MVRKASSNRSETRGTRSQVENHSANGPILAEGTVGTGEEGPLEEAEQRTKQQAKNRKLGRKTKLKWPRSNEAEVWHTLNSDLIKILDEKLLRSIEVKLNLFRDTVFQSCEDRFGEFIPRQRTAPEGKGRREKEITEREGLKALWKEVRKNQARLS